ncbi:glycosyltransferase family 39 protein [Ectobacillus ponti]|uniref:Glycosyltransferase family 39 protein n=1 Tax=Ectobacillus ponti TaxID=2961894 RepID=A0AA42BR56_9BACI|nr:glycosyltransferase family 39 protein [Ectobacillus ponti]MCP8970602.1 glycosyltransferase family 39 protein [Ectobacillus ponti]
METKQGRRFDGVLAGITVLAAFLNLFHIWNSGSANSYYTAAVTSMLQNFHSFFYASLDPVGFITVDKPPVAFWIQTVFATVLGVHGWSVILPQALAGVGSVLLVYAMVKPTFGQTAARLASLGVALTPIAVAVSRTNNIDAMLVFTLLLGAWMLFRGAKQQKLGWVLGAFAMIGVGFNMKMLQAFMVAPAFYLFYLLAFQTGLKKKVMGLVASTVLMFGVALSWAVVVDSIPASERPYIGSSSTNSVLELAFGYNGLSRLTGQNTVGGQSSATKSQASPPSGGTPDGQQPGGNPPNGAPGGGQSASGMFGTGTPGPLRLFQTELSGQASWLLPFVAFGSVILLAGVRFRKTLTSKEVETVFWLAWLLPIAAFFSVAGFFHHYYLVMLAPALGALFGAGATELWNAHRAQEGWKSYLLPAAVLVTTAFQLYIIQPYNSTIGMGWLVAVGVAGIGTALALFFTRAKYKWLPLAGILTLLIGPAYWSFTPIVYGDNTSIPQAGPGGSHGMGGPGGNMPQGGPPSFGENGPGGMPNMPENTQGSMKMGNMDQGVNQALLSYVTKNNTGEKYLFATTRANDAASYIIETGKAVMAMGGFSGSDPALTVDKLQQLVKNKEIKYFLIPSSGSSGMGGSGNSEVYEWIRKHSKEIPTSEWQGSSADTNAGNPGMGGSSALYEINQ